MSQKRSNVVYIAVHTMNGEPLTKGNMKALDALVLKGQQVVDGSEHQRLVLSSAKD